MLVVHDGFPLVGAAASCSLAEQSLADHVGRPARRVLEPAEKRRPAAVLPQGGRLGPGVVPIAVAVPVAAVPVVMVVAAIPVARDIAGLRPIGRVIANRRGHHLSEGSVVLGDRGRPERCELVVGGRGRWLGLDELDGRWLLRAVAVLVADRSCST